MSTLNFDPCQKQADQEVKSRKDFRDNWYKFQAASAIAKEAEC